MSAYQFIFRSEKVITPDCIVTYIKGVSEKNHRDSSLEKRLVLGVSMVLHFDDDFSISFETEYTAKINSEINTDSPNQVLKALFESKFKPDFSKNYLPGASDEDISLLCKKRAVQEVILKEITMDEGFFNDETGYLVVKKNCNIRLLTSLHLLLDGPMFGSSTYSRGLNYFAPLRYGEYIVTLREFILKSILCSAAKNLIYTLNYDNPPTPDDIPF